MARVYEKDGKLIVKGVDTLMGAKPVEIEADMVVLATAGVSNEGAEELRSGCTYPTIRTNFLRKRIRN